MILNSKYEHTIKKFHSFIPINTKQQPRKRKRKRILCQFWNTLAMSIFETLDHKLEVSVSIFCGTKKVTVTGLKPTTT